MDKINELVKNEISIILQREFTDIIISVTKVEVAKDISFAKIWVSGALGRTEEAVSLCKQNSPMIKKEMSKTIVLRKIPYLHFVPDNSGKEADRIDELLKQARNS